MIGEERSLRFRVEAMFIFMIIGVIFMTCIYMEYDRRSRRVSTVIDSAEITQIKQCDFMQIGYNITQMNRKEIKYIVVHDTGNTRTGANALNHYRFFNSGNQKASADFFIDSERVIQTNDYYNYYTWHCGDGGPEAKINNRNSIGIEICINSDGDYNSAVQKAIELIKVLMKELDIDADHVVRHYDASGKDCPMTMDNADWKYLKEKIGNKKVKDGHVMSYVK